MFARPDSNFPTLHKTEGHQPAAKSVFSEQAGGYSKRRASELPLGPYDEPTNEELGIVPYSGRVVLLGYVLYVALVVGFLVWLL